MKKLTVLAVAMLLAGVLPQTASAQNGDVEPVGFGLFGIGAQLGYVSPENIDGTIGFGAQANLGEVARNIWIIPSLTYWSSGESIGNTDFSFSEVGVNAEARYMFPSEGNVSFYAGGGLCLCFYSVEVPVITNFLTGETSKESNSESDIGFSVLGGATTALSPKLDGFGQLRYKLGDADTFSFVAGVMMKVGD